MNKIISKQQYSEKVFCFDIEAPLIARSRRAGNFVIVRVDKNGERMPLTIADSDKVRGTIKLVVQRLVYHRQSFAISMKETLLQMWLDRLETLLTLKILVQLSVLEAV